MLALGLSLGLNFQRPSVSSGGGDLTPQNLQVTNGDRSMTLTWDADSNLGYVIFYNTVDDINTATQISDFGDLGPGVTSKDISPTDDTGSVTPVPYDQTGWKYFFWIYGTDGNGTPVTGESNSATGRAYVTLTNGSSATLLVPDGAASMDLNDLLFGSTQPIPSGVTVSNGPNLGGSVGDGTWEDLINGGTFNPAISASFFVENTTGSSLTFWDTEP